MVDAIFCLVLLHMGTTSNSAGNNAPWEQAWFVLHNIRIVAFYQNFTILSTEKLHTSIFSTKRPDLQRVNYVQ
jgi:hypothetical protein